MSLSKYAEYRGVEIDWLGQIPSHWQVRPLKSGYSIIGGSTPKSDEPAYWDGDIDWVTPADLSKLSGFDIKGALRKITEAGLASCGTSLVPAGSIVLSTRAPIGSIGLAAAPLCTNQGCKALVPLQEQRSRYGAYALSVAGRALNVRGKGTTFLELSGDELGRFPFPFPDSCEQLAIASFLDRETAKIDALIAEQEKLLALLAEKRQATISHAVTRGLDPNAPIKDSGIPWLGEVPAHWEVLPLKRDLAFLTSGSRGWAQHYADEGALFLRIGNLTRDSVGLDLGDIQRVAPPEGEEGERTRVEPGDVLFSITAYLGSVAVVPEDLEKGYVSQHVALARLRNAYFLPKWVAYATLSRLGSTYLATQGYGGTKVQLSLDDIACLPVTAPPLDEQQATLGLLERELNKLENVRIDSESAIGLLRERRSALIAAAVTGQIDVRGLVEAHAA